MIHPTIELCRRPTNKGSGSSSGTAIPPSTIWMSSPQYVRAASQWGITTTSHHHHHQSDEDDQQHHRHNAQSPSRIILTCRAAWDPSTSSTDEREEIEERGLWERQYTNGQLQGVEAVVWIYLAAKGSRHRVVVVFLEDTATSPTTTTVTATDFIVKELANTTASFTTPQQIAAFLMLRCEYRTPTTENVPNTIPPSALALLDQCLYLGDNATFSALLKQLTRELLERPTSPPLDTSNSTIRSRPLVSSSSNQQQDTLSLSIKNCTSRITTPSGDNADDDGGGEPIVTQTTVNVHCVQRGGNPHDDDQNRNANDDDEEDTVVLLLTTNRMAITTALMGIVNGKKEEYHSKKKRRGGRKEDISIVGDRIAIVGCDGRFIITPTHVSALPAIGQILSELRYDNDVQLPTSSTTSQHLPHLQADNSNPAVVALRMEKGMAALTSVLDTWRSDKMDFLQNMDVARRFVFADLFEQHQHQFPSHMNHHSVALRHLSRSKRVCIISDASAATLQAAASQHFNPLSAVRRNELMYGVRFAVVRMIVGAHPNTPRSTQTEKADVLRQLAAESCGTFIILRCQLGQSRNSAPTFDEGVLAAFIESSVVSPLSASHTTPSHLQRTNLAILDSPKPQMWPSTFAKQYPSARITGMSMPPEAQDSQYAFSLTLPKMTYATSGPTGGHCIRLSTPYIETSNTTSTASDRLLVSATTRTSVVLPDTQIALSGDLSASPSGIVVLAWAVYPHRSPMHPRGFLCTMGIVPVRVLPDPNRRPLAPSPMYPNRLMHIPVDAPLSKSTLRHQQQHGDQTQQNASHHHIQDRLHQRPSIPAIPLPPTTSKSSPRTSAPNSGRVAFAPLNTNQQQQVVVSSKERSGGSSTSKRPQSKNDQVVNQSFEEGYDVVEGAYVRNNPPPHQAYKHDRHAVPSAPIIRSPRTPRDHPTSSSPPQSDRRNNNNNQQNGTGRPSERSSPVRPSPPSQPTSTSKVSGKFTSVVHQTPHQSPSPNKRASSSSPHNHHPSSKSSSDSSDDDGDGPYGAHVSVVSHVQPVIRRFEGQPDEDNNVAMEQGSTIRNVPTTTNNNINNNHSTHSRYHAPPPPPHTATQGVEAESYGSDIRNISRIPSRHTVGRSSGEPTPRYLDEKDGNRSSSEEDDESDGRVVANSKSSSHRNSRPTVKSNKHHRRNYNADDDGDDVESDLMVNAITARPTNSNDATGATSPNQQDAIVSAGGMYVDDRWLAVGRSVPSASSFEAAITPSEPSGAVTSKSYSLSVKRFNSGVVYIDTHLNHCEGILADLSNHASGFRGAERTAVITQKLVLCAVERGELIPVQRETVFDGIVDSEESVKTFWAMQHRNETTVHSKNQPSHQNATTHTLGTEHAFYNLERGKDYCVVHLLSRRYPQRSQDLLNNNNNNNNTHQPPPQDFRDGTHQYRVAGSLAPPLTLSQWLSKEDFIIADGVQFTTPTLFVDKLRIQEVHPRAVSLTWDGNAPRGVGYLVTYTKLQPTADCLRSLKRLHKAGQADARIQDGSSSPSSSSDKYCVVPDGIQVVSAPHIPPVTKVVSAGGCVSTQLQDLEPASVYRVSVVPNSASAGSDGGGVGVVVGGMPLSSYPMQAADAEEAIIVTAPDMHRDVIVPCVSTYRNPGGDASYNSGDVGAGSRVHVKALVNLPRMLLESWFESEQEIQSISEEKRNRGASASQGVAEYVVDIVPTVWLNDRANNEAVTTTGMPVGVEVRFELTITCPTTNTNKFSHKPGYVFRCAVGPFQVVRRLIASSVSATEARFFWEGTGRMFRLAILRRRHAGSRTTTSPAMLLGHNDDVPAPSGDDVGADEEEWTEEQSIHVDNAATSHFCTDLLPDTLYRAVVSCDGCVMPAECVFSTSPSPPSMEELRLALIGQSNKEGVRLPTSTIAVHNMQEGSVIITLPRRVGPVSHLIAKLVPAPLRAPTILYGQHADGSEPYLAPMGIDGERGTFWANEHSVQSLRCDVRESESAGQAIFAQLQFATEAFTGVNVIKERRALIKGVDPFYAPQRLLESDPVSLYAVTNLSLHIDPTRPNVELRFTCGQKTAPVSAGIGSTFTAATAGNSRALFGLEEIRNADRNIVQQVIVEGTSIMPEQCGLYALIPPLPLPEVCFGLEVFDDRALVSVDPEAIETLLNEMIPPEVSRFVQVQLEFTSLHLPTTIAPLPLQYHTSSSNTQPQQQRGINNNNNTNIAVITIDGDIVVPLSPKRSPTSTLSVILRVIGLNSNIDNNNEEGNHHSHHATTERVVFINTITTSIPTILSTPLVHDISSVIAHNITSTTAEIHWESNNNLFEVKVYCKSAGIQAPHSVASSSVGVDGSAAMVGGGGVVSIGGGANAWKTHHRKPLPGVLVYTTRTTRPALQLDGLLSDKMYEVVITGNQGGSHEGRFAFATPPVVTEDIVANFCNSFIVSNDGALSLTIPPRDKKLIENMNGALAEFEAGLGSECQTTEFVITVFHDSVDAVAHLCFPDHKAARRAQRRRGGGGHSHTQEADINELRDYSKTEWRLPADSNGNASSVVVDLFPMLHITGPSSSIGRISSRNVSTTNPNKPSPMQLVQDGVLPYLTLQTDSFIEFSRRKVAEMDGGGQTSMGTSASALGVPIRIDVLGVPSVEFTPDGQFATVAWAGSSQSYSVTIQNRSALDRSRRPHAIGPHSMDESGEDGGDSNDGSTTPSSSYSDDDDDGGTNRSNKNLRLNINNNATGGSGNNNKRVPKDDPLEQHFSKAAPTMTIRCADFPSNGPSGNILFITVQSSKCPSNVLRFSVLIPRAVKPLKLLKHVPVAVTVEMRAPGSNPRTSTKTETYLKVALSKENDTFVATSLHELPQMAQYPGFGLHATPLSIPLPRDYDGPTAPPMHLVIAEKTTLEDVNGRGFRKPWEHDYMQCLNPIQVACRVQGLPALTNVGGLRIEEITTRTATIHWNSIDDEFHCQHRVYRPVDSPNPIQDPSENYTVVERNIIVSTPVLKLRNLAPGTFHTVSIRGRRSGDALLTARFFTLPQFIDRSIVFRRHENGTRFTVLVDDASVGQPQYLHLPEPRSTTTHNNDGGTVVTTTYRVETSMELVLCNALDGGVSESFLLTQSPLTTELVEEVTTVMVRKRIHCVVDKPLTTTTPRTPRTPRNLLEEDSLAEHLQTETHAFVCKIPKPVQLSNLQLSNVTPNTAVLCWPQVISSSDNHQQQTPPSRFQYTVSVNPIETFGHPKMVKKHLTVVATPEITLTSLTDATLYKVHIEANSDFSMTTTPPPSFNTANVMSHLSTQQDSSVTGDTTTYSSGPHPALVLHDDCPPVPSVTKYFVTPSRKVIAIPHRRFPGGLAFSLDPCVTGGGGGRAGVGQKVSDSNTNSLVSIRAFSAVRMVPDNTIYVNSIPTQRSSIDGDTNAHHAQYHHFPPRTVVAGSGQPPTYVIAAPQSDDASASIEDHYQVEVPVHEPVNESTHRLEFYRGIEVVVTEDPYMEYEPESGSTFVTSAIPHQQQFATKRASRPVTVQDVLNPLQWNEPDVQPISLVRVVGKPHCVLCTTSKAHVRWTSSNGLPVSGQKMIFDVILENLTDKKVIGGGGASTMSTSNAHDGGGDIIGARQHHQVQRVAKEEAVLEGLSSATAYNVCVSPSIKDCPCEPLHFVLVTAPKRPKHLGVQITQLSALFDIPATVLLPSSDGNQLTISTTGVVICETDIPTTGCISATDYLAKGQTRNIFRSTPGSSQRVDLRLRSSKTYKFVLFTSVHHPESITGVMHSKPHIIEHETQSFPPQNLRLVTRTKASVTVGWTTLDFGSKNQVFEVQMAPLPKHMEDDDLITHTNAPQNANATFIERAFAAAGDQLHVKEVGGGGGTTTQEGANNNGVPSLHCTFSGRAMNSYTLYAFRVRQIIGPAGAHQPRRADPYDPSSMNADSDRHPNHNRHTTTSSTISSSSVHALYSPWSNLLVTSPLAAPLPARHLRVCGIGSNFVSLKWTHRRSERDEDDQQLQQGEEITFLLSCFEHGSRQRQRGTSMGSTSSSMSKRHHQQIRNMQRAGISGGHPSSLSAAAALYVGSDDSSDDDAASTMGRRSASPRPDGGPVAEVTTTETAAVMDGLEPGTEYRIVVIPSNHYGEPCPGNNAEIIVRTEGPQMPWK